MVTLTQDKPEFRWPNTVFARALTGAIQNAHKDYKSTFDSLSDPIFKELELLKLFDIRQHLSQKADEILKKIHLKSGYNRRQVPLRTLVKCYLKI